MNISERMKIVELIASIVLLIGYCIGCYIGGIILYSHWSEIKHRVDQAIDAVEGGV